MKDEEKQRRLLVYFWEHIKDELLLAVEDLVKIGFCFTEEGFRNQLIKLCSREDIPEDIRCELDHARQLGERFLEEMSMHLAEL